MIIWLNQSEINKIKKLHQSLGFVVHKSNTIQGKTRPAWAGFKTAEEGIAIIMSYIL